MRAWVRWMIAAAAAGLFWTAPVRAQTAAPLPGPPAPAAQLPAAQPANSSANAATPSPLDTFLLRDKQGNLVPVLGMPFEEFEQLLRAKKGLPTNAAPGYTLDRLSISGNAHERIADLEVTLAVRIRQPGWVRVPIQMSTAVVRKPGKHEGPGEFFLDHDEKLGGYVCWLKGEQAEPHAITLLLAASLASSAGERRLSLSLPHATESTLRLSVPGAGIEATLAGGAGILTTRTVSNQRTEIAVLGPAGDLQLQWQPRAVAAVAAGGQLDVNGDITVRIQSEHRITSDARLRVRSFGAPLEAFRVRLPAAMELLPAAPASGLAITASAAPATESPAENDAASQVVEVRLDKPSTGVTEVVLRAGRDAESVSQRPLRPARFEVLGALRQRGTIDFVMDGQWQLDWTEDSSVHRIDLTPEAAAAHVVGRFEYFRQPCGLGLRVTPQPSRVSVEPTHLLYVDERQVRIETLLKYRFRGSRASGLSLAMNGWSFDRLTPDALLDFPVKSGDGQTVQVPFLQAAAPPAELELKLEAHRLLTPGSERLELSLPRPVADIVAPATVLVYAADNLEIAPQVSEMLGLAPDPSGGRPSGREHPPLAFREFGGNEPSQFIAKIRKLPRVTSTSARAKIRIEQHQVHVEQWLEYRVAHEPQSDFALACPRELAMSGNLRVLTNDDPLGIKVASAPNADGLAEIQFTTPVPQLGTFQVAVQYALPLTWDRKSATALEIPLVLPAGQTPEQFLGQRVEFAFNESLSIEPDTEADDQPQTVFTAEGVSQVYSWLTPESLSRWKLEPGQASDPAPIHVMQMWVQTWLGAQSREERVALRLATQQENVRVKLPKGVRQRSIQTAVDGQEVLHSSVREPGHIVVTLPAAARGRACVLEIYYALEPPEQLWGVTDGELQTARIDESVAPRRVYWQLVLPQDQRLVTMPAALTSEMSWTAEHGFFAQRPVMDQRQLETWIRASRQGPLPRGVNEYLFGALGQWPSLRMVAAPRRMIVAVSSGLILVIGLVFIHLPRARSASSLLVLAVVLAAVAIAAPHVAQVAVQGAALGGAILIAAAAVARVSSGQPQFAPRSAAGASRESSLVHTSLPHSATALAATPRSDRSSRLTATAPAVTQAVEVRP